MMTPCVRGCGNWQQLAAVSVGGGCVLLSREGVHLNHKKLRRLYVEERLQVRRRIGRKRAALTRVPLTAALGPNQRWSMDFVHDALVDGRRFRILAVVDDYTLVNLDLVQSGEDLAIEQLVPHFGVGALAKAVLPRPARLDEQRLHAPYRAIAEPPLAANFGQLSDRMSSGGPCCTKRSVRQWSTSSYRR